MPSDQRDTLFNTDNPDLIDFEFNEQVAQVFPDMITRSVPGYRALITHLGVIARHYAQADSHCYDLGCSLGAVTLSLRQHIQADNCRIIGVDNSAAMIERCKLHIAADESNIPVTLRCEDILDTEIENTSIVVMNFTLQFIAPDSRDHLLKKIYQGMRPGGVLVLSEKISANTDVENDPLYLLHDEFKRANGYSEMEISQKRAALENVLIPESATTHQARLSSAGFTNVTQWFQCFNFVSLLAIK